MLKVAKVAEELNIFTAAVYNWIQTNRIKAIRLPSGGYRVPESELRRIKDNVVKHKRKIVYNARTMSFREIGKGWQKKH